RRWFHDCRPRTHRHGSRRNREVSARLFSALDAAPVHMGTVGSDYRNRFHIDPFPVILVNAESKTPGGQTAPGGVGPVGAYLAVRTPPAASHSYPLPAERRLNRPLSRPSTSPSASKSKYHR